MKHRIIEKSYIQLSTMLLFYGQCLLLALSSIHHVEVEASLFVHPSLKLDQSGNREPLIINFGSEKHPSFTDTTKEMVYHRVRRSFGDKTTTKTNRTPEEVKYQFNDGHYVAIVHWAGQNSSSIMVLMRDPQSMMKPDRPSAFYVSRDYGKTFQNMTNNFTLPNGTRPTFTGFFAAKGSNRHYILVAKFHKYVFSSSDECGTFIRTKVSFYPVTISYHPAYPYYMLGHEGDMGTRQLYSSTTNGVIWRYKSTRVKSFTWGYAWPYDYYSYLYYHRQSGTGSYASSILYRTSPWTGYYSQREISRNVDEFQLINQYIFVTKNSTTHPGTKDLFVSYYRGGLVEALFPTQNNGSSYIIADASENETLVAVKHGKVANLYISNSEGTRYSLSLSNILYYKQNDRTRKYFNHDFVDLHKVKGLAGIYIATQLTEGKVGQRNLRSFITFDKGGLWSLIKAPDKENNCSIHSGCSLHLSQEFGYHNPTLRFSPIVSKESAPGFIIATGSVGSNLKTLPSVYFSRDAGISWKKLYSGNFYYNFVDHGGVILLMKKYGLVDSFYYSYNEGDSWHSYKFADTRVHVYGILTEPGEKSTVFTIYGSYSTKHSWLIYNVNMTNVLGKPCQEDDYVQWEVRDQRNDSERCLLGRKQVIERRDPKKICYNGYNYERYMEVGSCLCTREDYKCDYGFKELEIADWWSFRQCVPDTDHVDYHKVDPSWCKEGLFYNISKGYVKVPGDICMDGVEDLYKPELKACKVKSISKYLMYATRDKIYRYDLKKGDKLEFNMTKYSSIVALEMDYKNEGLFFADTEEDEIIYLDLKSGNITVLLGFDETHVIIESLAYDWLGQNLYYGDTGSAEIGIINTKEKHKKTLVNAKVLDKLRALVVHPVKGYMFWTDWGDNPSISRANMDGTNITKLVETNIKWPNGLTIDYENNLLYFDDANMDKIVSIDFNGNNFKLILNRDVLQHPYALTYADKTLYWDDWRRHAIFSAAADTGNGHKILIHSVYNGMDIKAFTANSQKNDKNGCTGVNCPFICLPKANGQHVCTCPDGLTVLQNGNCKCPNNQTYQDGECKPPKGGKCFESEFTCKDGGCIPKHWQCDKDNDCEDGSDEARDICESVTCRADQFKCTDGRCILQHWKCDGQADCDDGSDEMNCANKTCKDNKVPCPTSGRCIPRSWLCDGDKDCGDGWDESTSQCSSSTTPVPPTFAPCSKDRFMCKTNGRCIIQTWRCDGFRDCQDNSDEDGCGGNKTLCNSSEFTCKTDGTCINLSNRCDQHPDCDDRSDEINCTYSTWRPPTTKFGCEHGVYCADRKGCYEKIERCDGMVNCKDGSDEDFCPTTKPNKCKDFLCASEDKCLPLSKVCDGKIDCYKGADEFKCPSVPKCLPFPFGFNCTRGFSCISHEKVCDGYRYCVDGSDEDTSICDVTKRVTFKSIKVTDNNATLSWTPPKLFVSVVVNYLIAYMDSQKNVKMVHTKKLETQITILNLKACERYRFAIAVNHVNLRVDQQLFFLTDFYETKGVRKPQTFEVIQVANRDSVFWEEDNDLCHLKPTHRRITCTTKSYIDSYDIDASIYDPGFIYSMNKTFSYTLSHGLSYKCYITIDYYHEGSPDFIPVKSKTFTYPYQTPSTSAHTSDKKKRNNLVWAIPVAIIVLLLTAGVFVLVYKYRRLQNSFIAFAARGSYSRQEDADDFDDDNMAVGFHTGEDQPMINRFSDDEPLVVA